LFLLLFCPYCKISQSERIRGLHQSRGQLKRKKERSQKRDNQRKKENKDLQGKQKENH